MKARIALATPAETEVTVTMTMTLAQWKQLREQVADRQHWGHPASRLRAAIRDLVAMAEKHFEAEVEPRAS